MLGEKGLAWEHVMARNILVICGHPDPAPERFCRALAKAYAEGAKDEGHSIRLIDITLLDLPLLHTKSDFETGTPPETVARCQNDILWAQHIVFIFPLWLGGLPALFRGFLEQIFRPDFAFDSDQHRRTPRKKLTGRSVRIVVTMGMPGLVYRWCFGGHGVRAFERSILNFSGLNPVRTTLIGMVEAGREVGAARLAKMRRLGKAGI
jgi:putative NADPH-quinone reductase